ILTHQGQLVFFSTQDGTEKARHQLPLGEASITSIKEKTPSDANLMMGLSNGEVLAVTTRFQVQYNQQGERGGIKPTVTPLFNTRPLQLDPLQRAIQQVTYQKLHDGFLVAGLVKQGEVLLTKVEQRTNFITGASVETIKQLHFPSQISYKRLLIAPEARYIFALTASGQLDVYNTQNLNSIALDHSVQLATANQQVTQLIFQLGQQSLLVGNNQGQISQWFMVRNADNAQRLTHIRTLKLGDAPIAFLEAEQRRKGFVAIDTTGRAGVFNTTAEKKALDLQLLTDSKPALISLAPRASMLLVQDNQGVVHNFAIDNQHPETSLKSLWGKVWYEGYEEPEYTWQSSSASTEFEPKFSLTPLAFGTLKAAFYAMLLSVPLAVCGAMYTAYFMAPAVRNKVKPVIELMEALPTVILGFFAGLFLAPFMESHLTGVFALLVIMPLGILTFAFAWAQLPAKIRHLVPENWHLVLVIPLVVFLSWFSFVMSQPLEIWFFAGDMRNWLTNDLGIPFDQRNAMVVG
ncbi:MAG: phosphate ABC transporter permease, partial [Pseudomonadaceae bacterium]|nr:phosphate ABC transporter permease [Pseudomonadaceae bacterium]